MNRKPSLLATLDRGRVSQLCADWARTNIVRAKPPEFANCGRKRPMHYPLDKLRVFVRPLKERKNSGLLFSRSKRLIQDATEIGAEPTVLRVRHLPRSADCLCNLPR
jgi:hypothetical protein